MIAFLALITACNNKQDTREADESAASVTSENDLPENNVSAAPLATGILTDDSLRSIFKDLKKQADSDANIKIQAVKIGNQESIQVNIKNLNFNSGSAKLDTHKLLRLTPVLNTLLAHPNTRIYIEGHTDSDGSREWNKTLSKKRAKHFALYFINNGISPSRVTSDGYGEEYPIASNETKIGKRENRRVIFLISQL